MEGKVLQKVKWTVNGTRIVPDGIKTWMQTFDSAAEGLDVVLTIERFEDVCLQLFMLFSIILLLI